MQTNARTGLTMASILLAGVCVAATMATVTVVAGRSAQSDEGRLPSSESGAKAALDTSPRHGEWVDIEMPGGQAIRTWLVYPEREDNAPVVLVIHEIYGLTDWIRGVADQLAEDGFIALAPDLLSGKGPGAGGTESVSSRDEVVKLVRELTPEEAVARLNVVREYGIALPAANGRSASIGFCWGGSTSFRYATAQPAIDAAVVYYGTAPTDTSLFGNIGAPVLGLYGGDDARVNATVPPTEAEMTRSGKSYEYHMYDGAGHGFLRAQEAREGANMLATEQAWPRTIAFLHEHTGT